MQQFHVLCPRLQMLTETLIEMVHSSSEILCNVFQIGQNCCPSWIKEYSDIKTL